MTSKEFSSQFDILYDNITSGKAPGLNDYEKSVFLTKAQDQLIKNYFTPLGNKYQEGHSDSHKRTIDFSNITKSKNAITGIIGTGTTYRDTMIYERPTDILIPRGFVLRNASDKELQVVSVTEEELTRLFSKPYKQPYKGQAYKLEETTSILEETTPILEETTPNKVYQIIVGRAHINADFKLYVRYVKVPKPIILMDIEAFEYEMGLEENTLSINGTRTISECELDPATHNEILDRAVNIAKIHYEGNPEGIIQYSTLNE